MTTFRAKFVWIGVLFVLASASRAAAEPVKFRGVDVDGKNIAFVCDGSRWMKNKVDDLAGELVRVVDNLSPDQQVSIIFFADDKAYGPADGKPLPATPENKDKWREWLRRVELGRDSTPIAGLNRAFESKPDTVFFISDGQFDDRDEVAARVDALNPKRATRVHTIAYFRSEKEDKSGSFYRFMKKLAEDNKGRFELAYVKELKRKS